MKKFLAILVVVGFIVSITPSCNQIRSACGMTKKTYKKKGKAIRKMGGGNMMNTPVPTPTP
ncbi:MAG: hypothetical protein COC01_02550 [Bacteroidetes bacterium]|nr:hypothetical protein [Bacteroidia bacterium]PCH68986.1 MAG: hypothetical protein COC01_02550 [Bacteroidota bacterium]